MESNTRTYEEVFWENIALKKKIEQLKQDVEDLKQASIWRNNIIDNLNKIIRQEKK